MVQVDLLADWTAILEPNGFLTSLPKIVGNLSEAGLAVSVFWNVNAVMSFTLAERGAIRRQFDPLLYDPGDSPLSDEDGLPFGHPGRPRAAAVALMSRVSGIELDRRWMLEMPHPKYTSRLQV